MDDCGKYVIVGKTEDGVEHFINSFYSGESWLRMHLVALLYKFKKPLRSRYKKIYLKHLEIN